MNLFEIINSIDNTLEKNIKFYDNFFISNFIDELKNSITVYDCIQKLRKLPSDTLFSLDRFEGDFAVCENRSSGEIFDIPKSLIDNHANEGDILKFDNNKLKIDYYQTNIEKESIKDLFEDIISSSTKTTN